MKNTLNLAAVCLAFVALGCGCPNLGKLARKGEPPPPPPSNTYTPSKTPAGKETAELTMAMYEKLKTDMPRREVERILGGPGTEISSSTGGGMTFTVNKWSGADYTSIILTFKNDRIMSKSQVGLK